MIWTDNMLIPKGGSVATASTYMNFVYDPKIAAQIAAYVNYVTPVKGAKEELAKTDAETAANNTLIFPDDAMLAQLKQYDSEALNNDELRSTRWQTGPAASATDVGSFFHSHRWLHALPPARARPALARRSSS